MSRSSAALVVVSVAAAGGAVYGGWRAAELDTPREHVYACRTPTVTTTNVMPNSAPTVETHAGYTTCRRVK